MITSAQPIIDRESALALIEALRKRIRPGWTGWDAIHELRRMIDELTPAPVTRADPVTANQLAEIRTVAKSQRLNAEAECFELFKCGLEELSKSQASTLLDHLRSKKRGSLSAVGEAS